MATSDPLIGRKLGDYIIVDILGQGGMARVYRGLDKKLNRYAAVKVIDAAAFREDEAEYRKRFQNEARAIARLTHPNIVMIYQFDEVENLYYMAMSFIEGKDLRTIIKTHDRFKSRMSYAEVLRVIQDIGSALDYAHTEGVIHRDIKPSNIMLTSAGKAILTDFGLALSVPEGTIGNTFGSAHYIAPEQAISSAQAVPQSDIYSLGIVLYEMLTNRVPFDDPSAMAVAMKHLTDPPTPPSRLNEELPPAVDAIIARALEKEPKKRYTSCTEMVKAVEAALTPLIKKADSASQSAAKLPPASIPAAGPAGTTVNLPLSDISRPSRGGATLDDTPTVTDSKASAGSRAALIREQQRRQRRRWLLPLFVVLAAVVVIAAVAIIGSGALNGGTPTPTVAENTAVVAAVTEAIQTPQATDEPPTATLTPTPELSATIEPAATVTDRPESSATPTVRPTTAEPSPTPSRTPQPTTAAPTARPSATRTPAPDATAIVLLPASDGAIVLSYDANMLILLNRSERAVDVSGLRFVQTAANGSTLEFETRFWEGGSRPTDSLPPSGCFQVQRNDIALVDAPSVCAERHAWSRVSFPRWFWLSAAPDATFEVRRRGIVLAVCPIDAGICAFDPEGGS
ncbi:MAG: protein kinase [Anaerolineae bacterium]|nr:protein kinase [Anaerolineae bacterium]